MSLSVHISMNKSDNATSNMRSQPTCTCGGMSAHSSIARPGPNHSPRLALGLRQVGCARLLHKAGADGPCYAVAGFGTQYVSQPELLSSHPNSYPPPLAAPSHLHSDPPPLVASTNPIPTLCNQAYAPAYTTLTALANSKPHTTSRLPRCSPLVLSLALQLQHTFKSFAEASSPLEPPKHPAAARWRLRIGIAHGAAAAGSLGAGQCGYRLLGGAADDAERLLRRAQPGEVLVERRLARSPAAVDAGFCFAAPQPPARFKAPRPMLLAARRGVISSWGEAEAGAGRVARTASGSSSES